MSEATIRRTGSNPMDCIFCKIVKNEIPSFKVWENDEFLAFLSTSPLKIGHTLLIPKSHTDYLYDMPNDLLQKLLPASKPIAKTLVEKINPKTGRVGLIVAGLEVPHAHLHLVPMDEMGDLTFSNAKPATPENLQQTLEKILNHES